MMYDILFVNESSEEVFLNGIRASQVKQPEVVLFVECADLKFRTQPQLCVSNGVVIQVQVDAQPALQKYGSRCCDDNIT